MRYKAKCEDLSRVSGVNSNAILSNLSESVCVLPFAPRLDTDEILGEDLQLTVIYFNTASTSPSQTWNDSQEKEVGQAKFCKDMVLLSRQFKSLDIHRRRSQTSFEISFHNPQLHHTDRSREAVFVYNQAFHEILFLRLTALAQLLPQRKERGLVVVGSLD